jgi:hypothetical protein
VSVKTYENQVCSGWISSGRATAPVTKCQRIANKHMKKQLLRLLGVSGMLASLLPASAINFGSLTLDAIYAAGGLANSNSNFSGHIGSTNFDNGLSVISAGANPGGLTFNGGGSFITPVPLTASNDFTSLKNQLAAVSSYTVETDLSTVSGPGNYSFASQSAIKSMTISIPGTYIFKYTGAANLANINVNITLGPGISSQDVIWYFPVSASFNNSNFAGEVVDLGSVTYSANNTSPNFSITDNGGIYAAGAVSLNGINGDALHFTTQTAVSAAPEPATFGMLPIGLLLGAISLGKRKSASR